MSNVYLTPFSSITPTSGALGLDLPDTEAQLFEIQHYPLLDVRVGVDIFGNEAMAMDALKLYREKGIGLDYPLIIEAHRHGDWDKVEDMCKEYPGLKIAFENFKVFYEMVKDDYNNPTPKK